MFDGLDIEVTNEFKNLSVYFTRGGIFTKAKKKNIAEQGIKALFALLKKIGS